MQHISAENWPRLSSPSPLASPMSRMERSQKENRTAGVRYGHMSMKQSKERAYPQPYLIRPRIYLRPDLIVGPGKIELLKAVRDTGSISAAARTIGMSYKRAWYLLDTLNKGFH